MARAVKTKHPLVVVPEIIKQARVYRVIAYVRLSVEDSGKENSETIENQKALLLDYIAGHPDMELHALYCDNGATGTDFDRPGFAKLMQDLKSGVADCVVVKDLSRFGRNYIETGNYLERVFPFLDVRFLSITDCFDTLNAERSEDGYSIPLKNMINHLYAKDISRKVGSALTAKQQKGEFIGGRSAYGYRKDPQNKNHLIVDEVAAPIVGRIFHDYASGLTIPDILRKLREENIPSPGRHHHSIGTLKSEKFLKSKWCDKTIQDMLAHEVYIGHLVQGRQRKSLFEGLPTTKLPKEQWIVVKDVHEPIISEEVFYRVQERLNSEKKIREQKSEHYIQTHKTPNILQGLIFCSECGAPMLRYKNVRVNKVVEPKVRVWYTYYCPTHKKEKEKCSVTSVNTIHAHHAIFLTLKAQIDTIIEMQDFLFKLQAQPEIKKQSSIYQRKRRGLEAKLAGIAKYRKGLFESYYAGIIAEQEFTDLSQIYEKEHDEVNQELMDCIKEERTSANQFDPQSLWITTFAAFQNEDSLTREMALTLIERIEVSSDKALTITLKYQDEYRTAMKALSRKAVVQ